MITRFLRMTNLDLADQRVLIRQDLNVPLQNGVITDDNRIQCALPTLKAARDAGARIIVMSHLGQPKTAQFDPQFSLAPIALALSQALEQTVTLVDTWLDGIDVDPGEIVLAENVRFLPGEIDNSSALAQKMAEQCDIFVMDAFATAHRAQASTTGITEFAPIACAGPLLCAELEALSSALDHPKPPVAAIVGGSKVSSKIQLLNALLQKVNCLIVGGGIANTLLAAQGYPIGKSLCEPSWLEPSQQLLTQAKRQGVDLPLPIDVVVAEHIAADAPTQTKLVADVSDHDLILDIGPQTAALYNQYLAGAKTIIWNGPVGVFELPPFSQGTLSLAQAIAASDAYSIAGGGDTVAALTQFGLSHSISYISTGGGAFLELMEGKTLPAIAALTKRVN